MLFRNKYRNKKVKLDGKVFDSIAESKRYIYLKNQETIGNITNLVTQPVFILNDNIQLHRTPKKSKNRPDKYFEESIDEVTLVPSKISNLKYIADFSYNTSMGTVVEDVKGMLTPVYKIKILLFFNQYLNSIYKFQEVYVNSAKLVKFKLKVYTK